MEVITKKQIPAILRNIAGRALSRDGLKWQITIGEYYDGTNRLNVTVIDKEFNSKTVYEAVIMENRKASIFRLDYMIKRKMNEWFDEKIKK